MDSKVYDQLTVSSSPHIVTKLDTRRTMMMVLIALCPAFIASIVMFGFRVIILTAVCVASSVFFEWGYEKLLKKTITIQDLSACVTGAIIAFNLPANFPYWMAIIGCFTAIVVVKQLFGGIGKNIANPAIVARIVLLLSFTNRMTTWPVTRFAHTDAATGATPLALAKAGSYDQLPSNLNMFLGMTGGAMGEVCTLAILIGGLFLIWQKVISPMIPCLFIGTMFVFSLIYYTVTGNPDALSMSVFQIVAGGAMFGAFFCATDYVTSPIMKKAKIVYAIGCGVVTMIIRIWGGYPEGVSFAILFMNILTPMLDNMAVKSFYAGGRKKKNEQ
ncbi:MAG: RnfABCDGE type electron transport complex subunit D [Eubacteriales bacterium]|nr:RnfABCDGE type electron transport complex subunit D [Eubacteriales bacterium]